MKSKVSGVPYEVDLPSFEEIIAELNRENFMIHARNNRLEDEIRYLETIISNLNIELINLKNKDRCPNHDIDDLK